MFPCGGSDNESSERVPRREFLAQAAGLASALTLGPRAVGLLRAMGLGASVTPILSGCTTHRSAEDLAQRLVLAINMDVRTLDPAMASMALDGSIICLIHENLTWFDRNLRLIPRLALSWETPDQAKSWIFKLRPNVKFHDGTDFNAEAVKLHFERVLNPDTRSNRRNKVKDDLEGVDVVDPLTVRFRMKAPYSLWPTVVRDAFATIPSPAAVRKAEEMAEAVNRAKMKSLSQSETSGTQNNVVPSISTEFYPRFPVGTGPYRFVAYEPDQYIRLEKNREHRDAHLYTFDEVEFRPVREPTTRLIMLEQGRVDVGQVMEAHIKPAEKGKRVQITSVATLRDSYIGLNFMKPPFNDVRVRRAVNYAVNRDEIVKYVFQGHADPMYGPIPPALPAFNREMEIYNYNPDKAKALLKEAGLEKGFRAVLWAMDTVTDTNLAVIVSEQLRRLGIELEIIRYDRAVYWAKFDNYQTNDGKKYPTKEGVFDMFVAGWTGGETPHGYLYYLFRSNDSSNSCFYENPEVDRLLKLSRETADDAERDGIYKKLQEIIVADAPWIFAYHPRLIYGVHPQLEGFKAHPAGEFDIESVRRAGEEKRA